MCTHFVHTNSYVCGSQQPTPVDRDCLFGVQLIDHIVVENFDQVKIQEQSNCGKQSRLHKPSHMQVLGYDRIDIYPLHIQVFDEM
mmetsp:Transcript_27525/g.37842  ORF Transcript_27525/g.37842 Transcript_27525/m.37842 type:complete len:85 (-) Transcript_27525:339-593(-)